MQEVEDTWIGLLDPPYWCVKSLSQSLVLGKTAPKRTAVVTLHRDTQAQRWRLVQVTWSLLNSVCRGICSSPPSLPEEPACLSCTECYSIRAF